MISEPQEGRQAHVSVVAVPRGRFGWLTERSGYPPLPDARGIQAVRGSEVLGMVVLDGFTHTIAVIHAAFASPSAAASLVRPAFRYAFLQLNLLALVTLVDSRNTRVVRLTKGLGFRETHRVKDGMELGADLLHLEMRRHECRALREVH